jgi:hypothetical protein
MGRIFVVLTALVYFSCSGSATSSDSTIYDMDSLINAQVNALMRGKRQLSKKATIGEQTASVTLIPDSAGWATELAVFRQLEIAERPVHRDRYKLEVKDDPNSNLRIRSFTGEGTPVPMIRFFYLNDPADVRRIESRYSERNALYISTRDLVMEFEEEDHTLVLRHFRVNGFQKIVMGDSVYFSVEGEVL